MTDVRGLIVSTPIVATKQVFQLDTTGFDSQELRYWLLFWDKLVFPQILPPLIQFSQGGEADYLESVGILERPQVDNVVICSGRSDGEDIPEEQYQYYHIRAFRELDKAEPGKWSLATGERSIVLDEEELEIGRGILLRLHRALPVPKRDVPLEDILEFKHRRRDELLALRCHLESVYQAVMRAPDGALAINTEITAMDISLRDYLKVVRGSAVKRWMQTSIEAHLQLATGVNAAVTAFALGLPFLQSTLTGLAASMDVSASPSLKDFRSQASVPWRYVSRYLEEFS